MRASRERAQVVDAGRLGAAELGVLRLIAPGDERGEAAGLVLQRRAAGTCARAAPRRSRPCPYIIVAVVRSPARCAWRMTSSHSSARRLAVAVQQLAHAVDENLGAAAGNAVEPGRDRAARCTSATRQLRQPREVNHFRRRQRVQLERRIPLLDGAEQILVPLERQIGIVAALQQQLTAAERDRLVDLPEDLLEAEHVAVARPDRRGRTRRSCTARRRRSCS